jgi:uncharacterized protein
MYSLPQEIEVWYIIPAVRKELARILTSKYDMTFEKAGGALGITKAAVSQYLSSKRASKFKIPKEMKKELEKSAELISKNDEIAIEEIQRIVALMRKNKNSCSVCRKYNPGITKFCKCVKC